MNTSLVACEPSEEEFAVIVRSLDLTLSSTEFERLRIGYGQLRRLVARLPVSAPEEPALAFALPGVHLAQ